MTDPVQLLLVEDNPVVRMDLEDALRGAGFDLQIAPDGIQALVRLEVDATRFHAVVTNVWMGSGPDGWEVGQRARERVPEMPVVYLSSDDSDQEWMTKRVPDSILIAKPFASAQIVTAVSKLLSQASIP